ncbi:MAG: SGNH/GDSL hydrolase family protein [Paludibacter sp.]
MPELKIKKRFYSLFIGLLLPLVSYSQATKQKIACVGNSITFGYGLSSPATQSYPAQMLGMLGSAGWEVGNFGVSSRTMLKKGDKPYWNEAAYTNAKAFLPNQVMIELGTNDAKTTNWNPHGNEFVSNYKEMIQVFQNLPSKPEVWVGLIPPGQHVSWTILFGYVKDSVNTKIKQIALESGVGLIDLFDAFNGNSTSWFNSNYFQADSIHPKTLGATLIAQKVKEMMTAIKPEITYSNGKLSVPIAYAYQWYYNDKPISEADGGEEQELVPTRTGKYKVSLKINSTNETRIISKVMEVSDVSSALKNIQNGTVKIFPNPVSADLLNIETAESGKSEVSVYDIIGKLVIFTFMDSYKEAIPIGMLADGLYFIQINSQSVNFKSQIIKI